MPSRVDRALLTVLNRTMSLDDPQILQIQVRAALLKMTGEELQAFVDGLEELKTNAMVEFDNFETAVEAAGDQTSPAIARSLDAVTRSSEAGVRNVADARTDGSAQTAKARLRKRKMTPREENP